MNFFVVGTNYRCGFLSIREKLSYSKRMLLRITAVLREKNIFKGGVILSTCNRSEFYLSTDNLALAKQEIVDFFCSNHQIRREELLACLYFYESDRAAKHLARVASGLDSLIIGELQILSQVKTAFNSACDCSFIDQNISKIFSWSLSVARKVHRETNISEAKASVGSVAVEFIKERLKDLRGKKILLIGMGKVTKLLLSYLQDEQVSALFISNRTYEKAKYFASQIGAKAVRFDDLEHQINQADVLITATKSSGFIINQDILKNVNKQILIIDLAMPRDVDPRVKNLKQVELFSLEDLKSTIKKNSRCREKDVKQGELIIEKEAEFLCREFTESELDPARLP